MIISEVFWVSQRRNEIRFTLACIPALTLCSMLWFVIYELCLVNFDL